MAQQCVIYLFIFLKQQTCWSPNSKGLPTTVRGRPLIFFFKSFPSCFRSEIPRMSADIITSIIRWLHTIIRGWNVIGSISFNQVFFHKGVLFVTYAPRHSHNDKLERIILWASCKPNENRQLQV